MGRSLPCPAIAQTVQPGAQVLKHRDWHGERLGFQAFPQPGYTAALVDALRTTRVDGDAGFLPADASSVHGELVDDSFVRRSLSRAGVRITSRTEERES